MKLLVLDSERFKHAAKVALVGCFAVQLERQTDIVAHIQHREEIVKLIDDRHLPAAVERKLLFGIAADLLAVNDDRAVGRRVNPAYKMHKRRFAGAARADNGDKFALFDG